MSFTIPRPLVPRLNRCELAVPGSNPDLFPKAARSAADIVFLDLPKVGAAVTANQQIGEVESTKTTSSIYTPVTGKIVKINTDLKDHPEVVNADPYGKGWIAVIELSDPKQVDGLMTAAQYEAFLASQKKG